MAAIPLATTPIYGTVIIDRIHTYQTEKIQCKKKAAVVVILSGTTT